MLKIYRRTIFKFQYTVLKSFGIPLQINCLVTQRPKHFQYLGLLVFLNWESLIMDRDSWFFTRWSSPRTPLQNDWGTEGLERLTSQHTTGCLKKNLNSSLSFGLAALILLGASSSLVFKLMVLLEDILPGLLPMVQVNFKSYLSSDKIYLSWTTVRDFFPFSPKSDQNQFSPNDINK